MKSIVVTTSMLDDMQLAARELAEQVENGIELMANSAGLLFCDSEIDHAALLAALGDRLSFPLIGCTTIGTLDTQSGFSEYAISLTVLTADDCRFCPAVSGPVRRDNLEQETAAVYARAAQELGCEPRMIFAFPCYQLDIMLDAYSKALTKVSGGLPVFGGLPSANAPGVNAILADGQVHSDRLGLLLIGGAAKPLFSTKIVLSNVAEQKRTVTQAKDNVIYRVGDVTFVEYLKSIGLMVEAVLSEDNTLVFVSNPLLVEGTGADDDGVPMVRTLHALDMECGSGTAIGKVPQGSILSVGQLRREDIQLSARACIEDLLHQIRESKADGYKYSTILCATCIGRFMIMVPDSGLEGEILTGAIGRDYTLSGFYGYGELCPTSMRNGAASNKAHNESITMCAL